MKILVTEDEQKIAKFLKKGLEEAGHVVDCAFDGNTALSLSSTFEYDIFIMDVMLPDIDGVKVVQTIRSKGITTPVLFLTALGTAKDKVRGLDSGGDDYLTKPFDFDELLARVRALTRRGASGTERKTLSAADLTVDLLSREVKRGDKLIELTSKEYLLLEYLLRHKNRPVSRAKLLEAGWNYNFDPNSNITDVYINLLRKKIDKDFPKKLIHTQIGVGYILKE